MKPTAPLSDQGVSLTRKQMAVLKIAERDAQSNEHPSEFTVHDELWPMVRSPRQVLNALVAKGLVRLVEYWDEEIGYLFAITDAGREALAPGNKRRSEEA
jgi:hypothetical protein